MADAIYFRKHVMQTFQKVRFPFIAYVLGVIVVILIGAASLAFNIPIKRMLVEAVQIYQSKFYIGFLSNLTAISWAAGAYCSLFTWWLLRSTNGPAEWRRFFLMAGCLTTV